MATDQQTVAFEENLIQFSSSLYGVINKTESICISPYSVTAALLLVMLGARGKSKEQISSAVFKNNPLSDDDKLQKYKLLNDNLISRAGDDLKLAVANRLFVNKRFTVVRDVRNKAKRNFGADISLKDFSKPKISAILMNRWVSRHTNNKIKDLVRSQWLNQATIMVIINAIYFKGTWKTEFSPKNTIKTDFYVGNTKTVKVDMMRMRTKVPYVRQNGYSAIALPYKGDKFDMVFILPDKKDGLLSLESKLSLHFLTLLTLNLEEEDVVINIPKFIVESEVNLKTELPKLGIHDIFNQFKANFSKLILEAKSGIYVSRAIHKVFIEVNEEGTEGTAATAVVIKFRSLFVHFIADHPFLFYIRDIKTGVVLFVGRFQPKST